ncbi:DUF3846 domain-containing protein [Eubacteriales bacterium OttesenSCG-928-M02]|nr:DUF3846 domain-containing protein [Eubacteriales bacterium OttesenSCG-928-M02]
MKVLMVEPGKAPYEKDIQGLPAMQEAVGGGLIQACYYYEEPVCLVCNEEGKINGMPLNRAIYDEDKEMVDIIAGPFFVCGLGKEDFTDLSPELMEKYKGMFRDPELFVQFNDKIIAIPAIADEAHPKGYFAGFTDEELTAIGQGNSLLEEWENGME